MRNYSSLAVLPSHVLLPTLFLITIAGFILGLVTTGILCYRRLPLVNTTIYLCVLVLYGELIVIGFAPFYALAFIWEGSFHSGWCKGAHFFLSWGSLGTGATLVLLSSNRIVVAREVRMKLSNKQRAQLMVAGMRVGCSMVICGLASMTIIWLLNQTSVSDHKTWMCSPTMLQPLERWLFKWIYASITCFIPVTLSLVFNTVALCWFCHHARQRGTFYVNITKEIKVTIASQCLVVVYAVSHVPHHVFNLLPFKMEADYVALAMTADIVMTSYWVLANCIIIIAYFAIQ